MSLVDVAKAKKLKGTISVPGDKSISHRTLLIGAMANGTSHIVGLSEGEDVQATALIVEQLGATRFKTDDGYAITGPAEGLQPFAGDLDCGNSGTTIRLLAGITGAIGGVHHLIGDESLSKRPMDRIAEPLFEMGIHVSGNGPRVTAPLVVEGVDTPRAISYEVPHVSAQIKSAIIFAALRADGPSAVIERVRTRSATEDMLRAAGIKIDSSNVGDGRFITVEPGRPTPQNWRVPGDPSQSAFFAVLGSIHPDAVVTVSSIDDSPERIGFVSVLQRMGADISLTKTQAGSSMEIRSSKLSGTEIHSYEIPSVDEVPALSVAACAATGVTKFTKMGELRLKESDRFAGSMQLAASLGCKVWSDGDDFFIEGLGGTENFANFEIAGGLDHRMVMSSAVAGAAGNGCRIEGAETVRSSYPNFFDDLESLT